MKFKQFSLYYISAPILVYGFGNSDNDNLDKIKVI